MLNDNVTPSQKMIDLEKKITELLTEAKSQDILVSEQTFLIETVASLRAEFHKKAHEHLKEFKSFYAENKKDLYYQWHFMSNTRHTDVISSISLSLRKKAIRVVFYNDWYGNIEYNVVLIPFGFIDDAKEFKKTRTEQVLNHRIKELIKYNEEDVIEIKKMQERSLERQAKIKHLEEKLKQ